MAELRWIQMFLLMILMLHCSAVTLRFSYITFRNGDDVALSCQNEINDRGKCSLTHWFFIDSEGAPVIDLVKSGQIDQTQLPRSTSDRLKVTEKCSLVIKNLKDQDVGRYVCRQRDRDSDFDLSVVTLTEEKTDQKVTLMCVVRTGQCKHTVKWLFNRKEVEGNHPDFQTSQSPCFTTVSFKQIHYIYPSRFIAFQCEVTQPDRRKQQFSFRQSDGDTKTTTSPTTTKKYDPESLSDWQWGLIAATLIIAAVVIAVLLIKNHGKKTQINENMADPQDGLSYASISFTQSSDQAQVQNQPTDAVTYSTVKDSSAAGASSDPDSLYAVIGEPK